MKTFYFTFGIDQPNYPGYARVRAEDEVSARVLMNKTFNNRWSFLYHDISSIHPDTRIERFDLIADKCE